MDKENKAYFRTFKNFCYALYHLFNYN